MVDGVFKASAVPGHIDTSVDLDIAVSRNQAAIDGDGLAGVEQDTAICSTQVENARFHNTVNRHGGCSQVDQFIGLDQSVPKRGGSHCGASGDKQLGSCTDIHIGVHTGGIHITARQDTDGAAQQLDVIADVNISVDADVLCSGFDV